MAKVALKIYLQLGKGGPGSTAQSCKGAIVQIRAMPMTLDPIIDNAASDVIQALLVATTIAGSSKEALDLNQMDSISNSKPGSLMQSMYTIPMAGPLWKDKLHTYMKYSPQ
eukprot:1600101-Pyramimonas_sp.AAC.1